VRISDSQSHPSARDVELFIKTVMDTEPWKADWSLPPVPWRHISPPALFKIGVMESDGVVMPFPAIRRGMAQLIETVKGDPRFQFMPYTPLDHKIGVELAVS
jgi:amidase